MGKIVKKVEDMENVIHKMRVVLYGVVKLSLRNIDQQDDDDSAMSKKGSPQLEPKLSKKEMSISFTGINKRKDTGIEIDISSGESSSDSSDSSGSDEYKEKMEIGRSIVEAMKGIYTEPELDQLWRSSKFKRTTTFLEDPMIDHQNALLQKKHSKD
jgi:hypothetical protein